VRDATAILLCYRHGLRVSELVSMRWSQIDFKGARIHIVRAKHGDDGTHPLTGRELRLLRKLQQEQPLGAKYIFMSERGAPIAPSAAQKVVKMAGKRAGIPFSVHIHMLRHSCGYSLINRGVDLRTVQSYLGHASISSTAVYTHLNATRFDGLWQD
jgi:type 1 fimbriae regulatory protein FimB/type 1 fimbriae regulatory protein FimE